MKNMKIKIGSCIKFVPSDEVVAEIKGLTKEEKENIEQMVEDYCSEGSAFPNGVRTNDLVRGLEEFFNEWDKDEKPGIEYLIPISKKAKANGYKHIIIKFS